MFSVLGRRSIKSFSCEKSTTRHHRIAKKLFHWEMNDVSIQFNEKEEWAESKKEGEGEKFSVLSTPKLMTDLQNFYSLKSWISFSFS